MVLSEADVVQMLHLGLADRMTSDSLITLCSFWLIQADTRKSLLIGSPNPWL